MRVFPFLVVLVPGALLLPACSGCDPDNIDAITAEIDVTPGTLVYGPVPVGLGVQQELLVRNTGQADLQVSELALRGAVNAFRVVDNTARVKPGESVTMRVEFRPPAEGAASATLLVRSNAAKDPEVSITLTGVGTPRSVCGDCNNPPANYCATARTLIQYEPTGTCVNNACRYDAAAVLCDGACSAAVLMCVATGDAGHPPADAGHLDAGVDAGNADAGRVDAGVDAGVITQSGIFTDPGEHSYVVPAGVTALYVKMWGGGGAGGNQVGATGGGGAYAGAQVTVTPGETLDVWVAEGGSAPGEGAGASWLRRGTASLLVAAGGGGGGSDGCSGCKSGGKGGAGGDADGQAGEDLLTPLSPFCLTATGGQGATASLGGTGGTATGSSPNKCDGQPGTAEAGGRATGVNGNCDQGVGAERWTAGGGQGNGGGGGGGAGWFGGGGAGFIWTYCAGGGGGGSSHAETSAAQVNLQAGSWQQPGAEAFSLGAGRGGEVGLPGAHGRVELRP